jgi:hypothetical protein
VEHRAAHDEIGRLRPADPVERLEGAVPELEVVTRFPHRCREHRRVRLDADDASFGDERRQPRGELARATSRVDHDVGASGRVPRHEPFVE